ncbi:gamma-glutamyl-gamma-aminobutyrate hydrolase family protein (plasmid) [Buchnera aphidicola (Formosaphis micheliae)]|uniref:glutamine amidotransferase-related protein n=1 Tax=Buchnera aphidicola TaxID=9 RepID=UPI0031B83947
MANILFIDNIDSFTYNLVDQLRVSKHNVIIYRNYVPIQTITRTIIKMKNPILILSPGPGHPKDSGCILKLLLEFRGKIPIVGICLGHQAIVYAYSGEIGYASTISHGKTSFINHDGKDMFISISNPFIAARYHSLICKKVPDQFVVNAHYNKMIMGIKNNNERICGFQFHPESILTTQGTKLLNQTLDWTIR